MPLPERLPFASPTKDPTAQLTVTGFYSEGDEWEQAGRHRSCSQAFGRAAN